MARILILEDSVDRIRAFRQKFIGHIVEVTKVPEVAIDFLKKQNWDYLFLDHDLGHLEGVESGPGTGYAVALYLQQNPEKKPENIVLHSLNPVGRKNMKMILPESQEAPFAWK